MVRLKQLIAAIIGSNEEKFWTDQQKLDKEKENPNHKDYSKHKQTNSIDKLNIPEGVHDVKFNKYNRENQDNTTKKIKEEMDLKINKPTAFDEFQLGKRVKKCKSEHKVWNFIEKLKNAVLNAKFKSSANMPLRKVLLLMGSL